MPCAHRAKIVGNGAIDLWWNGYTLQRLVIIIIIVVVE
jgi:hypothetical protein